MSYRSKELKKKEKIKQSAGVSVGECERDEYVYFDCFCTILLVFSF